MALDPARRARIVSAATALFAAYGYRRTSMDVLAREADVAKPTLYAYFEDKEAVFVAVVDQVLDAIIAEARAAAAMDSSVEERLVAVLDSKFGRLFALVHSSPHAAELLSSTQSAEARELADRADRRFRDCVTTVVTSASNDGVIDLARAGITRPRFIEALLQAGYGADAMAASSAEHHRLIRTQVRLLLGSVLTG